MINLYTLPGVGFNAPSHYIPLINGYLNNRKIETIQIDLSINFLNKNITTNYFRKDLKYYNSLPKSKKELISKISIIKNDMQSNIIDTEKILNANKQFLEILNLYANKYNINWTRKGLEFGNSLSTIDEVINYSLRKENNIFDNILIEEARKEQSIVYMSVQYPFQLIYAIRFSKLIKNNHKEAKIIFGGDYITHIKENLGDLLEKCNYIDSFILFGNHNYLYQLIKYYQNEHSSNIFNTIIRCDKKIIFNNIATENIEDIDNYIPNYDGINLNNYLSNLKLINLSLNYGCYHSKCKFCSRYYYYNGCFKRYNIDLVCNFIKEMYEKEKIEAIYFIDECVPPDELIRVAEYLIKNNIQIKWMVETRIDKRLLEKELPKLLFDSGCREISFGIESNNQKLLNRMDKRIFLKDTKKVMKNFYKSGITVSATFMLGYPGENKITMIRTLRFIEKFKYIDTYGLGVFQYMRNSILVNNSNLNVSDDLNLIYRIIGDKYDYYQSIIDRFNKKKKIKKFSDFRSKLLYRSEYLYLDRKKYSLNFK